MKREMREGLQTSLDGLLLANRVGDLYEGLLPVKLLGWVFLPLVLPFALF